MEEEVLDQQENNAVDIHPLKKGKRILLFLADFFIQFILSFLLFNVAVAPIGKAITKYDNKNDEHIVLTNEMYEHYYKSGVVFEAVNSEYTDITAGIEYTYRCFLSFFVLDNEESIDANYPQYGRKIENNVIYHYYHDIRSNDDTYVNSFKSYNEKNNYFVFDKSSLSFSLKNEVKNELYSFYDPKDEMGNVGKGYYNDILENVFNPMLAEVMVDIDKNDLHFEGEKHSFLECKNRIKELETYHDHLMTICALISHFVSWLALFLIVPLVNSDRKTLGMLFMKIHILNFNDLNIVKRGAYVINSIYYLFATMLGLMFVPSLLVPFNNLFASGFLAYSSIFAAVLLLADLIFLLINQYNRSLIDFATHSLYLTEKEMSELYRARGYKI